MRNRNTNPVIHLPGGGAVRRADVVSLTPDEMAFFRTFHTIAQKYGLGLHCSSCGADLVGQNTGHENVLTVSCSCREFKGENRGIRP